MDIIKEDITAYISTMIDRGFPPQDFELLRGFFGELRRSWNSITFEENALNYIEENKIDTTVFRYEHVYNLAMDYVQENIEPQFKVGEDDEWHDETYDMWNDVFVYFVEKACLDLFETDQQKFLSLKVISP